MESHISSQFEDILIEKLLQFKDEMKKEFDKFRARQKENMADLHSKLDSLVDVMHDRPRGKAYNILVVGACESEDKAYKVFEEMSRPISMDTTETQGDEDVADKDGDDVLGISGFANDNFQSNMKPNEPLLNTLNPWSKSESKNADVEGNLTHEAKKDDQSKEDKLESTEIIYPMAAQGAWLPLIHLQPVLSSEGEGTVNVSATGSPKAWVGGITLDLKAVLSQNANDHVARKVFDEMSLSFRAVLMDEQVNDPYTNGFTFSNLTPFDPGGAKKIALSFSRGVACPLIRKAHGTHINGVNRAVSLLRQALSAIVSRDKRCLVASNHFHTISSGRHLILTLIVDIIAHGNDFTEMDLKALFEETNSELLVKMLSFDPGGWIIWSLADPYCYSWGELLDDTSWKIEVNPTNVGGPLVTAPPKVLQGGYSWPQKGCDPPKYKWEQCDYCLVTIMAGANVKTIILTIRIIVLLFLFRWIHRALESGVVFLAWRMLCNGSMVEEMRGLFCYTVIVVGKCAANQEPCGSNNINYWQLTGFLNKRWKRVLDVNFDHGDSKKNVSFILNIGYYNIIEGNDAFEGGGIQQVYTDEHISDGLCNNWFCEELISFLGSVNAFNSNWESKLDQHYLVTLLPFDPGGCSSSQMGNDPFEFNVLCIQGIAGSLMRGLIVVFFGCNLKKWGSGKLSDEVTNEMPKNTGMLTEQSTEQNNQIQSSNWIMDDNLLLPVFKCSNLLIAFGLIVPAQICFNLHTSYHRLLEDYVRLNRYQGCVKFVLCPRNGVITGILVKPYDLAYTRVFQVKLYKTCLFQKISTFYCTRPFWVDSAAQDYFEEICMGSWRFSFFHP